MGTYTTNYNLYMPTVGEQGWGTLVNGNFSTIDTTMKGLDTRITAVENEVNGALSCTSVTTSGKVTANGGVGTTSLTTSSTITSTGKIYANGGLEIVGDVIGNVAGKISISSLGDDSENLKIFDMTCANVVVNTSHQSGNTNTLTLSPSDYTWSLYNTSIITYVRGIEGLKEDYGVATCTLTIANNSYDSMYYTVTITDSITNTVVKNTSVTVSKRTSNSTITFSRNSTDTYTISIKLGTASNPSTTWNSHTYTASVPSVTKYVL